MFLQLTFLLQIFFLDIVYPSVVPERSSDPLSFADHPLLPFAIGIPNEVTNDLPGKPLADDEFLYPPLVVDPPMNDGPHKDPIERAGLYEGDIIIGTVDEFLSLTDHRKPLTRNAVKEAHKLWENGAIPYVLSAQFDRHERGAIAFAMKEIHDNSCIRFRSKTSETDYVHIIKADGCSSSVGKVGGRQVVSLGLGCLTKGVVTHELLHSVGFWHEQARADRDEFITIIWSNIQPGLEYNFGKHDWDYIQNLSVTYDLGSIMHYGSNAFANDRTKPTIVPNKGGEIGQRYGLSELDILKLNLLYNCKTNGSDVTDGLVEEILPEAVQESENCIFWAKTGECNKNKNYMTTFCSESCKNYGNNSSQTCEDVNVKCSTWARDKECTLNPSYMLLHCKKACNLCPPAKANKKLDAKEKKAPFFSRFRTYRTRENVEY